MDSIAVLQEAVKLGIIDMAAVRESIEMARKEEILKKHKEEFSAIWQGKNGSWYTYLPDEEKGRRLIRKSKESALNQVIVAYWEQKGNEKTLEQVFGEWLAYKQAERIEEATLMRYRQIFNRHFGNSGLQSMKVNALTPPVLEQFILAEVTGKNLSVKGLANLRTVTKGFLKYARKRGYSSFDERAFFEDLEISSKAFTKRVKEDEEEVFSEEETEKILSYLVQNLDTQNMGILLMFVTGIRVGELAGLKHEDFMEHAFRIRRTETRFKREGDKSYSYEIKDFPKTEAGLRTVVIPKEYFWLEGKLKALNPFGDFIFTNAKGRMTTTCFRNRLYRICKKLGLVVKSPHKIRKTYGTILLDNGLDDMLVEELMGHTDISTTKLHYHRNRRKQDAKIERISAISDFSAKVE